ncbi:nucleotidyltransferase family protein [Salinisphaera aquimarina]|uniref:Nucleotidyltransferase family protein n=1 Tax=Salinisphaera aquimarina TaxID=2094031 RepID=A0ABV7EU15_9GAMM
MNVVLSRQDFINELKGCKSELRTRFGVTDLALFGSSARNTAAPDSDIDVLVTFDGPATSKRYFGVLFYLEDHFGRRVDLVTDTALRDELRPFVEREAIHV